MVQLTIEKNPPDILVNISRDTCGTYDFYRAEELVEIGRQSAIISLDEFEKEEIIKVETSFQDAENTNC